MLCDKELSQYAYYMQAKDRAKAHLDRKPYFFVRSGISILPET